MGGLKSTGGWLAAAPIDARAKIVAFFNNSGSDTAVTWPLASDAQPDMSQVKLSQQSLGEESAVDASAGWLVPGCWPASWSMCPCNEGSIN